MATNETSKYKLSVTEGTEYKLSVVDGTELQLSLNGPTGPTGPANVLNIGTVTTAETGVSASATITGSSPTQLLNLTLPKGNTGSTGPQGVQGIQGVQGPQGLAGDKYQTTSSTNLLIPAIGTTITLTVGTGLSYSTNQTVLISNDISRHIHAEIDSYNPTTGVMTAVVTDTEGAGTYSSWIVNLSGAVGAEGPQGVQGIQGVRGVQGIAGPNTITSSTSTDKTGYIFGNGTTITGATAAASAATANTLVIRDSLGAASFATSAVASGAAVTGTNSSSGIGLSGSSLSGAGVYGVSSSGQGGSFSATVGTGLTSTSTVGTGATSTSNAGTYHHAFGGSGDNRSAVERVRGWFVWFFGSFTGRLKTADITANREWTLPNESGTLTLDSHTHTNATTTSAGFMSSSDKTKLNNIGVTDVVINGVTFGRGSGNDVDSTVAGASALSSNTSGIWNSAFGRSALLNNTSGSFNVAVGNSALRANISGGSNTSIGTGSLYSSTTGQENTAIGGNALFYNIGGSRNTAVGLTSLFTNSGNYNSAFGVSALSALASTYENTTGLGYQASVTGSNQVQLGNSSTTTYAYGAVQNRSDVRDKADIRDTTLGLEFIDSLRPVDFKWDMREDYRPAIPDIVVKPLELSDDATDEEKSQYAEQLVAYEEFIEAKDQWLEESKLANITHDGSKKRSRYHHGLIAQEVKEVLDQQGIDFGGFQDHSLKGGDDVLSIGYIELIAPMIKAIQQLKARVEQLENAQINPIP